MGIEDNNQNEINTNNNLREWDIVLGRKTAPTFIAPVKKTVEPKKKDPSITEELKEFVSSIYEKLSDSRIDPNSESTLDCILCYKDGKKDGEVVLDQTIDWVGGITFLSKGDKPHNLKFFNKIFEMAKAGNLVFVEPGKAVNEAVPITVSKTGKAEFPNLISPLSQNDSRLSDAEYASKHLASARSINVEELKNSTKNYESIASTINGEAFKKAISKTDYINQAMTARKTTTLDMRQEYANLQKDGDYPKLNFKPFSNIVEKQRSDLSENAYKAYFEASFENHLVRSASIELYKEGVITRDEMKKLDPSRDFAEILFERGDSREVIDRNKERALKFLGKNLDPNDPDFADKKLRAQAEVFNERMESIGNFDYEPYIRMNDEQFVNNYKEYHTHAKVMSIFKQEYNLYKTHNPYLNDNLANKILDQEDKYGSSYMQNCGRIRMIANPCYAKFDLDQIVDAGGEALTALGDIGFNKNDVNLQRLSKDIQTVINGRNMRLPEMVAERVNVKNPGKRMDERQLFYDEKGKKIESYALYDYAKTGKQFYGADVESADSIKAFSYNAKKNILEPKKLGKESVIKTIKSNIAKIKSDKNKQAEQNRIIKEQNEKVKYYEDKSEGYDKFLTNAKSLNVELTDLIKEMNRKNLSVEKYADDYANRIYNGTPKKSYDEFCKIIGVPDNEKLSKDEINHRKALSAATAKALFSYQQKRIKGTEFEAAKDNIGMSFRCFGSIMCEPGEANTARNKEITEKINNGKPEEKKTLIENRLKELMKRSDAIIGKTFNEEQLLDNMDEFLHIGVSVGLEFEGFNRGLNNLKQQGVNIDPDIITKMTAYQDKMAPYINYYGQIIEYMSSPYYQYGGEKQLLTSPELMNIIADNSDPDFGKTATSIRGLTITGFLAIGGMFKESLEAGGKKVESFFDINGKDLGNDTYTIVPQYINGGDLLVHYQGEPKPQKITVSNMDKLNPTVEYGEYVSIPSVQKAEEQVKQQEVPEVKTEKAVEISTDKEQSKVSIDEGNNINLSAPTVNKESLKTFLTEKISNALGAEFNKVKFDDAVAFFTSHGNEKDKDVHFEKKADQDCISQMAEAIDNGEKIYIKLPNDNKKADSKYEIMVNGGKPELYIPEREHDAMMASLSQICNKINATGETRGDSTEFKQFKDKLNEVTKAGLPRKAEEYNRVMNELSSKAFAYSAAKLDQSMNSRRENRFMAANQLLEVCNASQANRKPNQNVMNLNIIASKILKTKLAADIKNGNPETANKAREMLGNYEKFSKETNEIVNSKNFQKILKNMDSKELDKFARKSSKDIVNFISKEKAKIAGKAKENKEPVKAAPDILNF